MTIKFNTSEEFYDGIYAMTSRNLMFKADFDTLTIIITGY